MFKKFWILVLCTAIKIDTSVPTLSPKQMYEELKIIYGEKESKHRVPVFKRVRQTYHLIINDVHGVDSLVWRSENLSKDTFIDFDRLRTQQVNSDNIVFYTVKGDQHFVTNADLLRICFNINLAEGGTLGKVIYIYGIDETVVRSLIFYSGICFATLYGGIKDAHKAFDIDTVGNNLQANKEFVGIYEKYANAFETLLKKVPEINILTYNIFRPSFEKI
jgi:hypothetical protein